VESTRERWKLPVGRFIEACHEKRSAARLPDHDADPQPPVPRRGAGTTAPAAVRASMSQVDELPCYLENLADDVRELLAHGDVTEVLPALTEELRDVAASLERGEPISALTSIPPPPSTRAPSPRRLDHGHPRADLDDDDIPF